MLLVEGKVRKLALKLTIEKTKVATLKWRQNFSKIVEKYFLDRFLKKNEERKACPKKVGLFQFKVGWFKIKARTNLGPQNYMCLSAPGNHFTCKSQTRGTILRVPFKTLMEVLPARLDPHLRKWGSLSRILRTTYIDL